MADEKPTKPEEPTSPPPAVENVPDEKPVFWELVKRTRPHPKDYLQPGGGHNDGSVDGGESRGR